MRGGVWIRGASRLVGGFLVLATVLPFWRTHHWWVRGCDFPRLQIGGGAALGAFLGGLAYRRLSKGDRALVGSLAGAAIIQGIQIFPYTSAAREEVLSTSGDGEDELRILAANVLQYNRKTKVLAEFIRQNEPDVIVLTETDEWWAEQMGNLEQEYPYVVNQAMDNTYGMMLYSKLELIEPEVRFLVKEDIPSIRTRMRLRNGEEIWFYGVHPEPPGTQKPDGDIRGSGPRDVELVMMAKEIERLKKPVLVAGDFNDVAWSHTTRLFKRISRLLDPRVGRGLYSTFHAGYPLLRWPLDHLFHSDHFALVNFERGPHTGSDHFPIFVTLKRTPEAETLQEQKPADAEDQEQAREVLEESPRSD